MGEKARLRAEVIEAQEQRDAAIDRAERAEAAYAALEATVAAQRPIPRGEAERRNVLPSLTGRFSGLARRPAPGGRPVTAVLALTREPVDLVAAAAVFAAMTMWIWLGER